MLGTGHRSSKDIGWTTWSDANGLHILTAKAASGYAWRSLATLSEPGIDTDMWIGNTCATGDGLSLVATYAPRVATNKSDRFDRGGFVAVVKLSDGSVTKLPVTSSLAYFSPACGNTDVAIVTQFQQSTGGGQTRVFKIRAATAQVDPPITVPGQLTSAVPVGDHIVAADANAVIRLEDKGRRRILALSEAVPFNLTPGVGENVSFMDHKDGSATFHNINARTGVPGSRKAAALARGPLAEVGLTRSTQGDTYLTGLVDVMGGLPRSWRKLQAPSNGTRVSTHGSLVVRAPRSSPLKPATPVTDPSDSQADVYVETVVPATGATPAFVVTPTKHHSIESSRANPTLDIPGTTTTEDQATAAGSPTSPIEAERFCSVPRNDVRNQAMQPKPRQVEWAVNQAVRGVLTVPRAANWKNLGMPAYTPQGLFPRRELLDGGNVPSQIMLGVIAQESNMWMAPGSVVPGVTGNPLIGNYYGLEVYDGDKTNDWDVRFEEADCGYGVSQVTDGMRLAGRIKPGETTAPPSLPYNSQRAIALDFAANVAAGLQILQAKWNETRTAGLILNNGDAAKPENWFYAVWAYNSGFYPQSEAFKNGNNGAWGVGWGNNPANPNYPANRAPFLELSREDARNPQNWPYPEKVMGWAGHPVEILESPGNFVAGYRAAWWGGTADGAIQNRKEVKPPLHQFCNASNLCYPGQTYQPNAPDVTSGKAGPCAHKNSVGQYDLKCWYHGASTWKPACANTCGYETLRFSPGYAYQTDGTAYPPNCGLTGLPSGALIVDDQPDATPIVRPDCSRSHTNQGSFSLNFASDASGDFPSKADFHQLGGGFSGHFWYAHTRHTELRGNSMNVTGTWMLNRTLTQWARVFVHMPDHGAHTQQARYEVDLGNGKRTRVALQRVRSNKWVSLGAFPFSGTPRVRLQSNTYDGDNGADGRPVENEDIAFDAVAFQPLSAKPTHIVASLGDSYSSGEGGSVEGGSDYAPETDNNGNDPLARNACHRSRHTWSRRATIAGTSGTVGALSDANGTAVEHHLLACSGAQTEDILPFYTAVGTPPVNSWGQGGANPDFGEVSQLDKGFVDADTTLVTMSIGGNDARFGDVVAECLVLGGLTPCMYATLKGSTEQAGLEIPNLIRTKVEDSVLKVLEETHKRAPAAKIVVMGYPELISGGGTCLPGLMSSEASWLNEMARLLQSHLQEAADRANTINGSKYVWVSDPTDEFEGKGVCGLPETIHGIVGPLNRTPGEQTLPLQSQQSFHPKIDGYGHYAQSLNATLRQMGL